jgi:hypothetical protein
MKARGIRTPRARRRDGNGPSGGVSSSPPPPVGVPRSSFEPYLQLGDLPRVSSRSSRCAWLWQAERTSPAVENGRLTCEKKGGGGGYKKKGTGKKGDIKQGSAKPWRPSTRVSAAG